MANKDYSVALVVDASAKEVFRDINNVTKWWTEEFYGNSNKLNDEFTVHFGDVHVSTQKLIEFVPEKKLVWLVTKSRLNFIRDMQEWNNTKISFELSEEGEQTQVKFTHHGLVPEVECYKDCSKGWDYYIKGSLFKLLTTGKGKPEKKLQLK
ncbi:MAG TPA: SRPBCC domain-containing protein [Puia sp.]|nr:SRPBCC domain-containing protein [Puia sp.]